MPQDIRPVKELPEVVLQRIWVPGQIPIKIFGFGAVVGMEMVDVVNPHTHCHNRLEPAIPDVTGEEGSNQQQDP